MLVHGVSLWCRSNSRSRGPETRSVLDLLCWWQRCVPYLGNDSAPRSGCTPGTLATNFVLGLICCGHSTCLRRLASIGARHAGGPRGMPDDEGGAGRRTCLLAGNCCPPLAELHQLAHCPQLPHQAMACLAIPNLPLLAAFWRGSVRITVAVQWNLFSTIG